MRRPNSTMRSIGRSATVVAILGLVLAACGGTASTPANSPAPTDLGGVLATPTASVLPVSATPVSPAPDGLARIALPVVHGSTVEGLVDVNGHDIYARCSGEGSPTVVYFTGYAPDLSKRGVDIAQGIERALGPTFRVCSYERRNTGRSATVAGTQTPEDVVADIDGVLAKLDEDGPFVLLGASFGGDMASAYALAHPDQVTGVVLLDAATGADYDIDKAHGFPGPCNEANRRRDANESLEKLDECSLAKWILDHRDQQPDVPLLYLAAQDATTRGDTADDPMRIAWVEGWSPGTWRVVGAPHWMDEADTGLVADAVREVINLTKSGS